MELTISCVIYHHDSLEIRIRVDKHHAKQQFLHAISKYKHQNILQMLVGVCNIDAIWAVWSDDVRQFTIGSQSYSQQHCKVIEQDKRVRKECTWSNFCTGIVMHIRSLPLIWQKNHTLSPY